MSRHSASPHPALGAFVHSYWGLARDLTSLGGFTVTPDQFVEVVFCGEPITAVDARGRTPLPRCAVIGLLDAPLRLEASGLIRCAAVRLHAWAKGPLLGSAGDGRGFGAAPLFDDLVEPVLAALREERWGAIWRAFDTALLPRLRGGARRPAQARSFLGEAALPAREVGDAHGIGRRQVERNIKSLTGSSPKQLTNLARFQRVRDALWDNPGVSLAALAADAGYADQPHLTRQFKRYAGVTPREFQAQMARLRAWQEAEDESPREVAIVQDPPEPGE